MPKTTLWYRFMRRFVVSPGLFFFYKKIELQNLENIPEGKPLLIVPNHQNSFMDALIITVRVEYILHYLARAKAFSNPVLRAILSSFNMQPVYRIRDGMSSVHKNNLIFDRCLEYLAMGRAVIIFPEASHDLKRRLRPLSKGFTRIAFEAELKNNWAFDMQVLPVGLNYSDHRHSRNTISIVFGEPVPVASYKQLYEEDEHSAARKMKEDMAEQMKTLIMHVPRVDTYNYYRLLADDLEPDRTLLTKPRLMNKRVAAFASHEDENKVKLADRMYEIAGKYNLDIRTAAGLSKKLRTADILLLPVYSFAFLNNILPYLPVRATIRGIVKDPAFDASVKLLMGILLFPAYYIIITGLLWLAGLPAVIVLAYPLASLLTSGFFKPVKDWLYQKNQNRMLKKFQRSHPGLYKELVEGLEEFRKLRSAVISAE